MAEIVCRATGQVIDAGDVDALASHWKFLKDRKAEIDHTLAEIALALQALCSGGARTRRLRGAGCRVRVEAPPDYFDQSALREIVARYTSWAHEYLRVDRWAVKLVEYRKLSQETGGPQFQEFKERLVAANRGPVGLPRIYLEDFHGENATAP